MRLRIEFLMADVNVLVEYGIQCLTGDGEEEFGDFFGLVLGFQMEVENF